MDIRSRQYSGGSQSGRIALLLEILTDLWKAGISLDNNLARICPECLVNPVAQEQFATDLEYFQDYTAFH